MNIKPAKPAYIQIKNDIIKKISPKTKAIMVVHIYGHPCDMEPIMDIANKYDLYVVEDAAEAHGAEYKGKKAGALGDVAAFSFYFSNYLRKRDSCF